MDATENLREQRELAEGIVSQANRPNWRGRPGDVISIGDAIRLAELVIAYHGFDSPTTITAEDLCKVLNTSALSPWRAGFVIVNSVRLRIDRDASEALKERKIGSVDASTGNRWMVAGGLAVELIDGAGWVPAEATKL